MALCTIQQGVMAFDLYDPVGADYDTINLGISVDAFSSFDTASLKALAVKCWIGWRELRTETLAGGLQFAVT